MVRRQPFISRVRLRNYKSIAECDVRLGPLTVLIGPNGSGKSNFLDALAFLGRAIETTPGQAIDERGGLDAILRAVPVPAASFSVEVEVDLSWWGGDFGRDEAQEESACGTYGFEVVRGSQDERYPFKIQNEACSLEVTSPDAFSHSLRFEVRQGVARDSLDGSLAEGVIEPDHLYLQVAGAKRGYAPLSRGLRGMRLYNFAYDTMREAEASARGAVLGARGQQLASVLGSLGRQSPRHKERLDAYLRAVVPGVASVEEWVAGPYLTLKLTTSGGAGGSLAEFGPGGMSDGTIRAVGVLAALFQPAVLDGDVPLVGIEEPEIALHPAAAGVLFDALTEASDRVQVLATSQSPDLFDRDDLDVDIVRAVSMHDGLTTIGDIDDASRSIVRDKLYTLGELMRGNQITPGNAPEGHVARPGA